MTWGSCSGNLQLIKTRGSCRLVWIMYCLWNLETIPVHGLNNMLQSCYTSSSTYAIARLCRERKPVLIWTLVWRFLDTHAAKLLQLLKGFPLWIRKIRDFIFHRRDERNRDRGIPLLQVDTEDSVESVNILIYQVLEQIYNNKTKASLRISSLISLWNILLSGVYGNLNWEHDIYTLFSLHWKRTFA